MMPNQNSPRSTRGENTCLGITALSVLRGQRLVIDSLNHSQSAGELCLLTGANGVGKSTLLRAIVGRLPVDSGHIQCHLPCVYIGHADGLSGAISGRKNLHSWASIHNLNVPETAINRALAGFNASDFADIPIQILSRGQRRRLALSRLLLAPERSLWLLDEPDAGLDSSSQMCLSSALNQHLIAGGAAIAATHGTMSVATKTIHLALGS